MSARSLNGPDDFARKPPRVCNNYEQLCLAIEGSARQPWEACDERAFQNTSPRNSLAVCSDVCRQRWKLFGFQIGGDRIADGGDGIMAALFQGAEDTHQDGLAVGAALAAVAVAAPLKA